MLRAVVIDDSALARKSIISDLKEFCPDVSVLGEADDVVSGVKLVNKEKPDLVFLDIEMGSYNGFDFIELLGNEAPHIIFITGSKDYAIKAFKVNAVDYLLKPIDPEELKQAVEKVTSKHSDSNAKGLISFHTQDAVRWCKPEEIIRLEAQGNYTLVYFQDGTKLMVAKTLKEYDKKLNKETFIRVHQSHLVNINQILSFIKSEGGYLKMKNGDIVSVSVRKRAFLMDFLAGN